MHIFHNFLSNNFPRIVNGAFYFNFRIISGHTSSTSSIGRINIFFDVQGCMFEPTLDLPVLRRILAMKWVFTFYLIKRHLFIRKSPLTWSPVVISSRGPGNAKGEKLTLAQPAV